MKVFTIDVGDANRRADKVLFRLCPNLPKSAVFKAFRNKKIKCNGKRCAFDAILNAGDRLEIYLSDDAFGEKTVTPTKAPWQEILKPVFESPSFLIVDKPEGVATQGGTDKLPDLTAAAHAWAREKNKVIDNFLPAPCHRLDTNTSGLVVFARTAAAARSFITLQEKGGICKEYLTVCVGHLPKKTDFLCSYWAKDEKTNKVRMEAKPFFGAKEAKTHYRLLAVEKDLSLAIVRLETGRSHQIRSQMQAIGCPLLGDTKYGDKTANHKYNLKRQLLTAFRLTFSCDEEPMPAFAELDGKTFYAKLPAAFGQLFPDLEKLLAE